MSLSVMFLSVMSAIVIVKCQQPLFDLSEISPYLPSRNSEKSILQQCETFAQALSDENDKLKTEIRILRRKVEAMEEDEREEEEEEREEEEEEEEREEREEAERNKRRNYEPEEPSKGLRNRRGAACDGGTLAAWACAPQCIFKLKGLCGLSLKSICHC